MGLDQYVYADKERGLKPGTVDVETYEIPGCEEIAYFRKHHDLQGWMSQLAEKRGAEMQWGSMIGSVVLSSEDLDELEKAVLGDDLPETAGFFFGSGNTEHYKGQTIDMIRDARAAIAEGKTIIYDCSW